MATGKVTQVIGTVVDVEFPSEDMPAIYNALETSIGADKLVLEVEQHIGNNWVRCLALGATEGLVRGVDAVDTGQPIAVPVGDPTLGRLFNALGETLDNLEEVESGDSWAHPSQAAHFRRPSHAGRSSRDRHQGYGSDNTVHQGRQDWRLRRRRRGQDGYHPRAHPQHRHGASGRIRVRRRGRALARRQRPVARNAGIRRAGIHGAGVRADERTARHSGARGTDRAHDGGILQRRAQPRCAAVHRQHLPLHPRGNGSVGAAGQNALRGGIPAHALNRNGRSSGTHHILAQRLHHIVPSHLCAGGRLHRPRHRNHIRPPRRRNRA